MPVILERRYSFSASHLYSRPEWSAEENRARFGKCANPPGHGHNYRLTIRLLGEVEPKTGFLVDLPALDAAVDRHVLQHLDHQHVNHAIPDFAPGGKIPSSEELVTWIADHLAPTLPAGLCLIGVRLEEDVDLAAEWAP